MSATSSSSSASPASSLYPLTGHDLGSACFVDDSDFVNSIQAFDGYSPSCLTWPAETTTPGDDFFPSSLQYDTHDPSLDHIAMPTPELQLFDISSLELEFFDHSGPDAGSVTSAPHEQSGSPSGVPTPPYPGLSLPSKKRQSPPAEPEVALKRQRNNIAARKYRQKRIDRISELEAEVEDVKQERDDLRIRLARQEAETAALREILKMSVSKGLPNDRS